MIVVPIDRISEDKISARKKFCTFFFERNNDAGSVSDKKSTKTASSMRRMLCENACSRYDVPSFPY